MKACGAGRLLDCNGRMVGVEHTGERMNRIIPLSKDIEKDIVDIDKWRSETRGNKNDWILVSLLSNGRIYEVKNVVLKDEHPINFVARKNDGDPRMFYMVNFWEIDQKQYDELGRYLHFLDV